MGLDRLVCVGVVSFDLRHEARIAEAIFDGTLPYDGPGLAVDREVDAERVAACMPEAQQCALDAEVSSWVVPVKEKADRIDSTFLLSVAETIFRSLWYLEGSSNRTVKELRFHARGGDRAGSWAVSGACSVGLIGVLGTRMVADPSVGQSGDRDWDTEPVDGLALNETSIVPLRMHERDALGPESSARSRSVRQAEQVTSRAPSAPLGLGPDGGRRFVAAGVPFPSAVHGRKLTQSARSVKRS